MATVTGLTAARMQEIIDQQIIAGAVDLSGHLIMERADGSEFDAGSVQGPKGDDAVHPLNLASSGADTYIRIGIIDGLDATTGGHLQFMLSGIGNKEVNRRATVLVHAVQRGLGVISLRAWTWDLVGTIASAVVLYSRQTGDYLFEIWAKLGPYTQDATLTLQSAWNSSLALDNKTGVAPSSLVAGTLNRSDGPIASTTVAGLIEIATDTETQTGTDATRAVSPSNLASMKASGAEVAAGSNDVKYVTPKKLRDEWTFPQIWLGNGNSGQSLAAGTGWLALAGSTMRYEPAALPRDLLVEITHAAIASVSTGYWMCGISVFDKAGGGWAVLPELADSSLMTPGDASANNAYATFSPFSTFTGQSQLTARKFVRIPAGIAPVIQAAGRRSVSGSTVVFNYSNLMVVPVRWL